MQEPVTTVTDYILFAENLIFGILLLKNSHSRIPVIFWGTAFLTLALAALAGGTYHGFPKLALAPWIWKITVLSIGVTGFLMLSAAWISIVRPPVLFLLIGLTAIKLLIYSWWMMSHDDFKYVIYDYLPAMILILILQIIQRGPASSWILSGIILSFAGAAVQQSGFSFHRHFNFNDMYHVIQMFAMYLLYRGGRLVCSN